VTDRDELVVGVVRCGRLLQLHAAERHAADGRLLDVGRQQQIAELSLSSHEVVETTQTLVRRLRRPQPATTVLRGVAKWLAAFVA